MLLLNLLLAQVALGAFDTLYHEARRRYFETLSLGSPWLRTRPAPSSGPPAPRRQITGLVGPQGGEAISESVWTALRDTPGTSGYNLYGPTETTVDALAYGTGYAQAKQRLFLTHAIRLTAQGRTAELLGRDSLEADIEQQLEAGTERGEVVIRQRAHLEAASVTVPGEIVVHEPAEVVRAAHGEPSDLSRLQLVNELATNVREARSPL